MDNNIHHQLDEVFNRFNEAIVVLYDDLLNLYPKHKRIDVLQALKITLQESGRIRRHVQTELVDNPDD